MRSERHTHVGIDIGSHTTRVVVCVPETREGAYPRILGIGKAPSEGMRHGYIADVDEATRSLTLALRAAEKSVGGSITSARITMGGVGLSSHSLVAGQSVSRADQEVTELDVTHALRACEQSFLAKHRNQKILHMIPTAYRIDGADVFANSPVGLHGNKLEVVVTCVSCLKHHYDNLIRVIRQAGITPTEIIASPLALSYATLSRKQRTVGCAIVDIGSDTTSLALFEHDTLLSLSVFPIGSNDISNDIALGFQLPLEDADSVKRGRDIGVTLSKRKIDDIVEARLLDIFDLIQNMLRKQKRDGLLPGGIIFTGGGSGLLQLENVSKTTLKLPALIQRVDHIPGGSKHMDASWLTAYGACVISGDEEARPSTGKLHVSGLAIRETLRSFFEQFLP